MGEVFQSILLFSLWGAIAAGAILLVKRVLGKKVSHLFHYAVWAILLLKLLVPMGIESPISLLNVTSPMESMILYDAGRQSTAPALSTSQNMPDLPDNGASQDSNSLQSSANATLSGGASATVPVNAWDVAFVLWICGMAIVIFWLLLTYIKQRRAIYSDITAPSHHVNAIFSQCKQGRRFARGARLVVTQSTSPFVFGFIRPIVVLPQRLANIEEEAIRAILDHELTHISRLDPLIRLISLAIMATHWFNPVLWYAFVVMRKDCELSCDESVLKRYDQSKRSGYGQTLYDIALLGRAQPTKINPLLSFCRGI